MHSTRMNENKEIQDECNPVNAYINYTDGTRRSILSDGKPLQIFCSGAVVNLNNILKDMCEAGRIAPKTNQAKSDDNRSQKPPVNKQLQQPTRATGGKHFKHGCQARHGVDES